MTKTGWILLVIGAGLLLLGGVLYVTLGAEDREFAVLLLRLSPTPVPLAISLLLIGARQRSSS